MVLAYAKVVIIMLGCCGWLPVHCIAFAKVVLVGWCLYDIVVCKYGLEP